MMKRMAIETLYRRPNTSKPTPGHKIYPYLLRSITVERSNQVWAMDITYIPMARGFVYLAAVVDWFSRRVLAWRLSITMEVDFCLEAVEEALAKHGRPEIFNTDQGSQFTSAASPASFWGRPSPSAWTARERGGTTFSSSGSGARSNTRKSISEPTTAAARPALRSADIWTSTTVSARIRASTPGRRITPTSTACRRSRQHEFRRRFLGVTLVGLRPPGVPPRKRHPTANGRGSTYRERKSVQTNPATSDGAGPSQRGHHAGGEPSRRKLQRGVFYSVVALQTMINDFVAQHNQRPTPFVWRADPKDIIAAVERGHQTSATIN